MSKAFAPRVTPWKIDASEFYALKSFSERMHFLVRYAVLAPSSRNTQPWAFSIVDDGVHVYADYTRRLPAVDPHDRELLMSVGAAITNFRVAAAHFGFRTDVRYAARATSTEPVAFIEVVATSWPDAALGALFDAIPKRHTNRQMFNGKPLGPRSLSRLYDLLDAFPETLHLVLPDERQHAAELTEYAERLQMERPELRAEIAQWIRVDGQASTDGLPASAFGVPRLLAAGASWFVRRFSVALLHSGCCSANSRPISRR